MRAGHTIIVVAAALLGLASTPGACAHATNLPDVPQGVFNASARIEIHAHIESVWDAVLNFPRYPDWNPFVRSAIVTDEFFVPLPADQQRPVENKRLVFQVQIPPLPLPVDASTPPNPMHNQSGFENVTHVQHVLYRVAWRQIGLPTDQLESERWSALSKVKGGKTVYESREVFHGSLALTLKEQYGKGLQEGFEAQAQALKILTEGR